MRPKKVVVIGGGAAGFFGAISCAKFNPEAEVTLLEKSNKFLSKVKVSGGGRCNVTNGCFDINLLLKGYPRGGKALKYTFQQFSVKDTIGWFESRGAELKQEEDGRIFPKSDNSQTIIDCLIREARVMGVKLMQGFGTKSIRKNENGGFSVHLFGGESLYCDEILIATGGNPNHESYQWLKDLGHEIKDPVPSLFTFNVPDSPFRDLQGISVPLAKVRVTGSKLEETGPVLITHWGLSGPAVLRLSAWGARELAQEQYRFIAHVNWISGNEESLRSTLSEIKLLHPKKTVVGHPFFNLPRRLWERMCELSDISSGLKWVDMPKKNMNKLLEHLLRSEFGVKGKTTFKEEFVTCGGVSLDSIDIHTMESKSCPGLFFAGEVLDIDGITGGYNFQAAWSTGFVAGKSIAEK